MRYEDPIDPKLSTATGCSSMMHDVEEKLHAFLQANVRDQTAPFWSAAIVNKDGVSDVVVAGEADPVRHIPVQKDSLLWYASASKLIIALAILRAIEQGLVKGMPWDTAFDDTDALVRYMPELKVGGDHWFMHIFEGWIGDESDRKPKLRKATKPVSLRHLLTWSCGTRGQSFDRNITLLHTPGRAGDQPILRDAQSGHISTLSEPRYFEADEGWGYGTQGNILGVFLARATGMTQREAVQKLVVEPLGISSEDMNHYLSPSRRDRTLTIYAKAAEGWQEVPIEPASASWERSPPADHHDNGNAGLYGTIGAYAIVLHAILTRSPKLLSRKAWEYVLQDDLQRRGSRVIVPDPLWTDEAAPGATATVRLEEPDVGMSLLQAIVERKKTPSGLAPGTISWHGFGNSTWFVDSANGVAGVCGTQTLPFFSDDAKKVFYGFRALAEQSISV